MLMLHADGAYAAADDLVMLMMLSCIRVLMMTVTKMIATNDKTQEQAVNILSPCNSNLQQRHIGEPTEAPQKLHAMQQRKKRSAV